MPVPASAVEKYRRLEAKADALRAALNDQQAKFLAARDEAGRLENILQSHARSGGQRLEVDEAGQVFWRQFRRGQPVPIPGTTSLLRQDTEERRPFDDPAAAITARHIVRLRSEAGRALAERDGLNAQVQALGQLVRACRDQLEHRGWREDGEGGPLTVRDDRLPVPSGSVSITRPVG